ncbi:hypothetical protein F2P56_023617 [Juglans regia]|uniref:Acyltransferase-like protein At1g54570, chloroplastic n=1 Tax=Juglans regia TaxID=51240 RepID=A0A833TSW5_JUGRE|nr:hypothetical protein F2P56_023617 [Juglans regia]
MASVLGFRALSLFASSSEKKDRSRGQVRSSGSADSTVLSSASVVVNGTSIGGGRSESTATSVYQGNGRLRSKVEEKKRVTDNVLETLEPLWDDGYGTYTVRDYFDMAKDIVKSDGGPPRWFCPVACGCPLKDSPVLLFLPGMDGTGMGLVLHHKSLGKAFEVRCLHIPVHDRTPFEGLVKYVGETVKQEHASSPNKPIYLVGDSLGGCLALAVASRNPTIDLVIILANPATSFGRSQLQPLFPILEAMPDGLHSAVPYLLSSIMGDPVKMAMVNIESRLPPGKKLEQLSLSLTSLLPYLSGFDDIIPKNTLLWKLKLLKSAAAYTNSRLHAVKAEVLILSRSLLSLDFDYCFGIELCCYFAWQLVLDYNDLIKIPVVKDFIRDANSNMIRVRDETSGEVGSQELFIPGLLPKIPGRFYYLFGKPIETKGRNEILKDKKVANQLYLQIKSEVERNMAFLIKKREEDPYRSVVDRTLYKAIYATSNEIPAFEP